MSRAVKDSQMVARIAASRRMGKRAYGGWNRLPVMLGSMQEGRVPNLSQNSSQLAMPPSTLFDGREAHTYQITSRSASHPCTDGSCGRRGNSGSSVSVDYIRSSTSGGKSIKSAVLGAVMNSGGHGCGDRNEPQPLPELSATEMLHTTCPTDTGYKNSSSDALMTVRLPDYQFLE